MRTVKYMESMGDIIDVMKENPDHRIVFSNNTRVDIGCFSATIVHKETGERLNGFEFKPNRVSIYGILSADWDSHGISWHVHRKVKIFGIEDVQNNQVDRELLLAFANKMIEEIGENEWGNGRSGVMYARFSPAGLLVVNFFDKSKAVFNIEDCMESRKTDSYIPQRYESGEGRED